jgi:hypothetical protein
MQRPRTVPLWFKFVYTAFCAVLIPTYIRDYGPTNFLYFCDVALLTTLVAIWLESPLLVSAPAVGILFPQLLWVIDFSFAALGLPASGTTAYMFSPHIPLFTRGLSFFHAWLPFALAWLVWRLGYDKRALPLWTISAWILLLISYFLMPAPPAPANNPNLPVNINFAYGIGDAAAQTWMHPLAWLAMLFVIFPVVVFYPTHMFLNRFAPKALPDAELSLASAQPALRGVQP